LTQPKNVRESSSDGSKLLTCAFLANGLKHGAGCIRLIEKTNLRFSEKDIPEWVGREVFERVDDDGGEF
jgi:hypothetical protein